MSYSILYTIFTITTLSASQHTKPSDVRLPLHHMRSQIEICAIVRFSQTLRHMHCHSVHIRHFSKSLSAFSKALHVHAKSDSFFSTHGDEASFNLNFTTPYQG